MYIWFFFFFISVQHIAKPDWTHFDRWQNCLTSTSRNLDSVILISHGSPVALLSTWSNLSAPRDAVPVYLSFPLHPLISTTSCRYFYLFLFLYFSLPMCIRPSICVSSFSYHFFFRCWLVSIQLSLYIFLSIVVYSSMYPSISSPVYLFNRLIIFILISEHIYFILQYDS